MPSKRYRQALKLIDLKKQYDLEEAIAALGKLPKTKFDQTVDLAIHLGVNPRQSDQMVRGTAPLPHGTGKTVRVLVFAADGSAASQSAIDAGAEFVGYEEYLKKCREGWSDFDVAISTPDAMIEVRKLGKILGPKGLMPNPKIGTVTEDTAKAVTEVKAGRVEFKIDKAANVHVPIGKLSFSSDHLKENAETVIDAVLKAKPASAKGTYLISGTLSGTMSPPVHLNVKPFMKAA